MEYVVLEIPSDMNLKKLTDFLAKRGYRLIFTSRGHYRAVKIKHEGGYK